MLVIENYMGFSTVVNAEGPGGSWTRPLGGKDGDEPGRMVLMLDPGHYTFDHSGSGLIARNRWIDFEGHVVVDLKNGDSLISPVFYDGHSDEQVYTLLPPSGCPGYVPPPPAPAAQCPEWYIEPSPGAGSLVLQNHLNSAVELVGIEGINSTHWISAGKPGSPGILIITLSPGSYLFEARNGSATGQIRAEIKGGQLLGASISRVNPRRLFDVDASAMPAPAGCVGYVPPTPPASEPCPSWFIRPEPGKGVLVVINARYASAITAITGMEYVGTLPGNRPSGPGILHIPVAPGHYEFATINVTLVADIAAGQTLVAYIGMPYSAIVDFGQPPAACQ